MDFLTALFADAGIQEALIGIIGLVLTVIINRAAGAFTAATGMEIEKKHREALHEALMSGAMSAIKHGPGTGIGTLKAHAIAHARQSVPQAVKTLVPGDTVLDSIAERYVREALARFDRPALDG